MGRSMAPTPERIGIAALSTVPLLNLIMPILGICIMTHLYHQKKMGE